MNVYFACSITGGREFEQVCQTIVQALLDAGHVVPTAFLAGSEVVGLEQIAAPQEVFSRDVEWIRQADALIAEVSTPSHGVGYEVAFALSLGKPVLCCYQQGRSVSKMITGNSHPNIAIRSYDTPEGAVSAALDFLHRGSPSGADVNQSPL
jgi:2'-deoxynucleoside 5'-phosphate N-hydrolase